MKLHIPDGYLGPQTYLPAYAVMVPLWAAASNKLKKTLHARQLPLLALGAAFSFVIMMFNVPIPGGTTGHAVGAVLIAILLGPWAAVIAVSLALIVQALLFGDGGITAIAANCLNMAVVMPFTGWGAYHLIAGASPADSRRRRIGAAIGGYIGLNMAALTTAVMFGIQPMIARDAAGHALYNPFGLKIAVPAMAVEHLLVFGFVEAVVTGLVVAYIQRTEPGLLRGSADAAISSTIRRPIVVRLGIAIGVLVVASPLGLYLPAKLAAGSAWGEWSADEIEKLTGLVPAGLSKLESLWHAPMPDYALRGHESNSLAALGVMYILSGAVGALLLALAVVLLRRFFSGKGSDEFTSRVDGSSDRS